MNIPSVGLLILSVISLAGLNRCLASQPGDYPVFLARNWNKIHLPSGRDETYSASSPTTPSLSSIQSPFLCIPWQEKVLFVHSWIDSCLIGETRTHTHAHRERYWQHGYCFMQQWGWGTKQPFLYNPHHTHSIPPSQSHNATLCSPERSYSSYGSIKWPMSIRLVQKSSECTGQFPE